MATKHLIGIHGPVILERPFDENGPTIATIYRVESEPMLNSDAMVAINFDVASLVYMSREAARKIAIRLMDAAK